MQSKQEEQSTRSLSLFNFGFSSFQTCSVIQRKNEGKKGEGRGRGGEAEKEYLEKKQPDSPAVCKLIAQPPVTWQKREGGRKEKGRKKEK